MHHYVSHAIRNATPNPQVLCAVSAVVSKHKQATSAHPRQTFLGERTRPLDFLPRNLSTFPANCSSSDALYQADEKRSSNNWRKKASGDGSGYGKFLSVAAIVGGMTSAALMQRKNESPGRRVVECCGIVGYIGHKSADSILVEGVQILQNRGYDSCGISTVDNKGNLFTTKFASRGSTSDCIELLAKDAPKTHGGHSAGIAHTRWATHGAKTDVNAHPHHDYKDRISLIHNGTIENYAILKQQLLDAGIPFRSATDTEVIANLIGQGLDKGMKFEEAVKAAVSQLRGTWGLVVLHKDQPDRLVLARNGSPLLVGSSEDQVFVASEPLALARHTSQFLPLNDGEIAVVTREGIDHLSRTRELQTIHEKSVEVSPTPFPHWTLKEIFEQPQSLARALNYGGRISISDHRVKLGGLDDNRQNFLAMKNLLISGCGTSLYASLYGELLMQYTGGFDSVRAMDSSEVDSHSFPIGRGDSGLLLLSQSGETFDVIRACKVADALGVRKFSAVNVVGSLLARMTNCGVYLNAGREVAVASTKAFTSQVTVLSLIASWFAQQKVSLEFPYRVDELMSAVQRLPVYAGMTLSCEETCKKIASKISDAKSLFVLGKGFSYPVALEGALKIKEISYIHAEGFAGGALKHGPFALIDADDQTPVIMIIPSDEHLPLMMNAAEQVKARGARLVCITDDETAVKGIADDVIILPSNGPLTALLAAIPLQLLAYYLAVGRGLDPDKPRGLAKTVTVS